MTIPDYQSLMLPLLDFAGDGIEHRVGEAVDSIAKRIELPADELKLLLPSGSQTVFRNRVGWAKSYLVMAELLAPTRRGFFRISPKGKDLLMQSPSHIDVAMLKKIPAFLERYQNAKTTPTRNRKTELGANSQINSTPEEQIESSFSELRDALAVDLLNAIKKVSAEFFERLVVDLLVKMGYGGSFKDAGQAIGKSGDEGIDGVIKEDKLGLDVIYLQAKRWDGKVGRPEIQKFAGALQGQRARKGVFITTGEFTADAEQYAKAIESKIVLIDGYRLADLMIDHQVGVATASTYEIKRIDEDYFADE